MVVSDTEVKVDAPAGSGTVDVTVTTPGGTSTTSSADRYAYVTEPTVTELSPGAGPTAGGTAVTIRGTALSGADAVDFGTTPATGVKAVSATEVTAVSPPGSGTVNVTVTTPAGPSADVPADRFVYDPLPRVTKVQPASGPTAGGNQVTITGTGLTGTTSVHFGTAVSTGVTVLSGTEVAATAPAGTGTVDITVTTPGGTSATVADDHYTYRSGPGVTSVSPDAGPPAGGTAVTITGTGLAGATMVKFGKLAATSFTVVSGTEVTALAPAEAAGTVDITVTTPGGTTPTDPPDDQFTYDPVPTVTKVTPASGSGGTSVTVTGTGFTGATAVDFGTATATRFTVDSATKLTTTAPAGSGTVDVTVTTPGGSSATTSADRFRYVTGPAVTSLSPNEGPAAGGNRVTITGTSLTGASAVHFGATAASAFTVMSATEITVTAPAYRGSGPDPVDVTVTTPVGTSATVPADRYTYTGIPAVSGLAPATGLPSGGTQVTITGTGFAGATAVDFGATPATGFTVVSTTEITATSPAGTATVDVTVSGPGGTSATVAADQFTYAAPYTPVTPDRLLDTRPGTTVPPGGRDTPLGAGQTLDLPVTGVDSVPADATAVVLNVTATGVDLPPGAASYMTVYPAGVADPPIATTSTLNYVNGQTVANLTEVGVGQGGAVAIYNNVGTTNVVVDLEGYVAPSGTSYYDPITPTRILDTRAVTTVGTTTPAVPTTVDGAPLAVHVEGQIDEAGGKSFTSPVPSSPDVTAVVLNLTSTGSDAASWLTVWPDESGHREPTASNVNFSADENEPNRVVVPVGPGGVIDIADGSPGQTLNTSNVLADVTGYFTTTPTDGLVFSAAPAPIRLVNTRTPTKANPNPNRYAGDHVVAGTPLSVHGTDTGGTTTDPIGIAADAESLEANVTVTGPDGPTAVGWLTLWPDTISTQPLTSDLNYVPDENVPNMDLIDLAGPGALGPGEFNIGAASTNPIQPGSVTTDVLVDVGGWYVPAG